VIARGHRLEKWDGLHGEVHVILLHVGGVEGKNPEGTILAEGNCCGEGESREDAEGTQAPNHKWISPGRGEYSGLVRQRTL
jgi:hypothetical protein